MPGLAEHGAVLLGGELRSVRAIGGGDLSQVLAIRLADGREAIVKGGPAPQTEAKMLRAIAATGAPAPAVLAVDDSVLVLELLLAGGDISGAWPSLGVALAALHGARGERYGWSQDYAFGAVAIPNGWAVDWPSFWAERRLLTNAAHIPPVLARRIEALVAGISDRLPARPAPALLHGDLWSGNILASGGRITGLIDPACYYGHAEVDFAMLTLFGQTAQALFDAYGAIDPGHDERRPVYQLWPALVHLRLFGGGYRALVERLLAAAGV